MIKTKYKMPSLNFETLKEIISYSDKELQNYKTFIETGTHLGETIVPMSNFFDELHTIELSELYYQHFSKQEYNTKKIKSYLGDSSKLLPEILTTIDSDSIFFLDGHYSSDQTAKGEKDVPLIEEISAINHLFKNSGIIIIDDLRLFGTNLTEDWSQISKDSVLKPIKDRVIKSFEHEDRFIIVFS